MTVMMMMKVVTMFKYFTWLIPVDTTTQRCFVDTGQPARKRQS